MGLTYFLANPPEADKAIAEVQKSLAIDSKHEKSLQVMTQALVSENKMQEAAKYLTRLEAVNSNNSTIPDLSAKIKQNEGNEQK